MRCSFVQLMMVAFATGLLGSAGAASSAPFRLTTTGTISTEGLGNPPNGPTLDRFGLADGDRITFLFDFDDQDISAGPEDSVYVGLRARTEIKGSLFEALPRTKPFRLSIQARPGSSLALEVS